MTTPAFTHFVFVDFENIPAVDLALVEGKPIHVTLLLGKLQKRLDTSFSLQLHRYATQVRPIEVGASGHNALDLTLAYYLGIAAKENAGAGFYIVSKDKDFDPLIAHMQASGIPVSRHDSFAGLPFLTPKKASLSKPPFAAMKLPPGTIAPNKPKSAAVKFDKFVQHLRNSPPSNKTKLEHMIEAYFKPSFPAGGKKGIIAELLKTKIVEIDDAQKVKVFVK